MTPDSRQEAIADARAAVARLAQERDAVKRIYADQRGAAIIARGHADGLDRAARASETRLNNIRIELSVWHVRLENLQKGLSR